MNISICKLHPDATTPAYATEGSACFDLHAILDNDVQHVDLRQSKRRLLRKQDA
jgi:dUTPase